MFTKIQVLKSYFQIIESNSNSIRFISGAKTASDYFLSKIIFGFFEKIPQNSIITLPSLDFDTLIIKGMARYDSNLLLSFCSQF